MVNRFFLDTNAIVLLLQSKANRLLSELEQAEWIGISVISVLEFSCFSGLSPTDQVAFDRFVERVDVVDVEWANISLMDGTSTLRKKYRCKLPDAIIAASAMANAATLVTADQDFSRISELSVKRPLD
jgi:predicted nucleic acid-binding protein